MTIPVQPFIPPLFQQYHRLRDTLPFRALGVFPTPLTQVSVPGAATGRNNLFVKNDGVSGTVYGGNKVRKLEFLLADAQRCKAVRVITCGAAGSNHALATALYARHCGLKATLILFDQPPSKAVCNNLLMDADTGAEMVYEEQYDHLAQRQHALIKQYELAEGVPPYAIPAGGSSEVGVLGYLNAAFELRDQIAEGALPEPEAIYVALGTMGTVAGLALGLRAAGCASRICAVRVVPNPVANMRKLLELCGRTNDLLRRADPSFPRIDHIEKGVTIIDDYFAPGYGLASKSVEAAVRYARETCKLDLDTTYSGKAFAAFLSDARKSKGRGPLLFWNTKNALPLPGEILERDYTTLPKPFHRFFAVPSTEEHGRG